MSTETLNINSSSSNTIGVGAFLQTPRQSSLPDNYYPGKLTWEAEGVSDPRSKYYSRRFHQPSLTSGVTIGRGYDMKHRSKASVTMDFYRAGMGLKDAKEYAEAAGLTGKAASDFIKASKLPDVSSEFERELFKIDYRAHELDAVARLKRSSNVEINWHKLHPSIKEVVIDLRYRGDLTTRAITQLQHSMASNDLAHFTEKISDKSLWRNVPHSRFLARQEFLKGEIHN